MALNLLIPAVQVIGGLQAHSVALLSDAAHNFSDFTAVLIAYVAHRIGRRGASVRNTFGYRRVEILAAAVNVALLLGAAAFIVTEAVHRLRQPDSVAGRLVVLVAMVGVVGNGLSAWLLHRDARHNLNVRGAFLHMLGDLLTSAVVVINGLVLMVKPWYWLDPLLSLVIAIFIVKNCWVILKEATAILMNATPSGLDIHRVREALERIPGIQNVHHLHAWNVCATSVAFSCHVVVPDQRLSTIGVLQEKIRQQLLHQFGIDHPVLQFETSPCGEGEMLCALSIGNQPAPDGERAPSAMRRFVTRKPAVYWVRLSLGAVFAVASVDKILHPAAFAQAVYNYQVLPDAFINLTAIILPWLELLLGLLLIGGRWLPGAAILTNLLLLVFFGALVFNVSRGLDVHCGCFSTSSEGSPATAWYLIRDAIFLALGCYLSVKAVFRPDPESTLGPTS